MFRALLNALRTKNRLNDALELTNACLEKAEILTRSSMAALLDGKQTELDIYALDREINQGEMEVRRRVFEYQLLDSEADITPGLVLISTIIDIERIGDYAKNIFELSQRYPHPFSGNRHFDEIREIAEGVMALMPQAAKAFSEGDIELAEKVMHTHSQFSRRLDALIDSVVEDGGISAREAVIAALAARYTKRISAHLSNLASSVVNPFDRIGFRPGDGAPEDADN
jgi:phosphate transport system protein